MDPIEKLFRQCKSFHQGMQAKKVRTPGGEEAGV